jgi:septal ring factor EnvC (AmiA/AmiB activator)
MVKRFTWGWILIFSFFSLFAQGDKDLKRIEQEISRLRKELKNSKTRMAATIQLLQSYERKIQLLNQSLREIEVKMREESGLIDSLQKQYKWNAEKLEKVKNILAEQTKLIYMKGIMESPNSIWMFWPSKQQFMYKKHVQFLLKYEIDLVKNYKMTVDEQKRILGREESAYKTFERLKKNQLNRKKQLLADKRQKEKLLKKIQTNRQYMLEALKEKQRSYEKLKKMLASLNRENKKRHREYQKNASWRALKGKFHALRGKLNWPVKGKILHRFGKIVEKKKNEVVLVNNGIDIRASEGASVRAIHDGYVTKVVYLGPLGNSVIIDHNDGYFSVYSHMQEATVREGEFVPSGHVIGHVGSSFDGTFLHFEIWAKNKPVNPQKWLARR